MTMYVLRNFSAVYLTYNMSVICCNPREVKTCCQVKSQRNVYMTATLNSG